MNETEIKTQLGLILQGILAEALTQAGYTYVMDPQYDTACEIPDFLIPDDQNPRYVIEVHQTEARNSFQMKTLRTFTAVTEVKAIFGNDLISVNVLFGDPDNELPASNVKAMCSFFDVNYLPRQSSGNDKRVIDIESFALKLAGTEGISVKDATDEVIKNHRKSIKYISSQIKSLLKGTKANAELSELWNLERKRSKKIAKSPKSGDSTYYKRMMLRALYFNDKDFAELVAKQDPTVCSASVKDQITATGLGAWVEGLMPDDDVLELSAEFSKFINDTESVRLRELCITKLNEVPEMKWFFEDIRDIKRRKKMANVFMKVVEDDNLSEAIRLNLDNEIYGGLEHPYRCWICDSVARYLGVSHNYMNKALISMSVDPLNMGNPFNQLCCKSDWFMSSKKTHKQYSDAVEKIFRTTKKSKLTTISDNPETLSSRLFTLRLDGAIKLRKLDPLILICAQTCNNLKLSLQKVTLVSVISDFAKSRAASKFVAYEIANSSGKSILMNAVAVHDHHGDDKSKEWGARRQATLYRYQNNKFTYGEYADALFVLDGEWDDKSVARLHRSGWNHICRLTDLESKLKKIFNIKGKGGVTK